MINSRLPMSYTNAERKMLEIKDRDEIEKYYESLSGEQKTIQFLLNALVCSAYDMIEADAIFDIIGAVTTQGPPPFHTFLKFSEIASDLMSKDVRYGIN